MSVSKTNKIPSGISIDIEASPEEKPVSKSLFGFSNSTSSKEYSTEPTNKSNDGYLFVKGKRSYIRIGLIVVILLFLGVNIFSYLGDFFQHIKDISAPIIGSILKNFGYVVIETTKDVTELTAEGAKLGIDVVTGTVESGIDVIQGQLDIESGNSQKSNINSKNNQKSTLSNSLSSALADAEYNSEPIPDDATSSTQRIGPGKAGYCYIGEDRGFRSCISVKDGDTCMSGDIFPSNEICVNPSLRE
jgi:hypothetical protein